MTKWFVTLLTIALALACARAAQAQASAEDEAAAELLFDEGRTLMKAGNFAEACGKFAESQRLDAGVGTLIYLSDCYEKSGRLASAWATFRQAAAAARAAGQADREQLARDRAAALHPKLARIVINVPEAAQVPGIEVQRDATPVGPALWGSPVPVDAGKHVIKVTAPGKNPWSHEVAAEDESPPVSVEVPTLDAAPTTSKREPAMATASTIQSDRAAGDGPDDVPGSSQRILGYVVTGTGVVALGAGIYFWQNGRSKHDEAVEHCDPQCDATARSLQDEAQSSTTLGNIGMIGGGVLILGGAVLLLTAPSAKVEARLRVQPRSIALEGIW